MTRCEQLDFLAGVAPMVIALTLYGLLPIIAARSAGRSAPGSRRRRGRGPGRGSPRNVVRLPGGPSRNPAKVSRSPL